MSGFKEAITAEYPMTEYRRCIVHVVRNTLKYVADKDKKLPRLYEALGAQIGLDQPDV